MAIEDRTVSSTVAAWPLAVMNTLNNRGLDGARVLAQAGLELAELRGNPGGRVSTDLMTRLWTLASEASVDPAIGLWVGRSAMPMHVRVMGLLIQTAPTLGHILQVAERFQRLITTGVTLRLLYQPDRVGLEICELPSVALHPASIDAFVSAHVSNLRRLAAGEGVQQVDLKCPAPADSGPWQQVLGCTVCFDKQSNVIWHQRAAIDWPLALGDVALWREHEQLAQRELAELDTTPALIQDVRGVLRISGDTAPTQAELAAKLAMSERSLRRRLAELGSGYRQLVDLCRAERAAQLVLSGLRSAEVAHLLGFSDASSFGKAFRRWYGTTPEAYRHKATD